MSVAPTRPTESPSTRGYRWRVRIVGEVARIDVHQFLGAGAPRLRRALLNQDSGEEHEYRHLQELALPILEQRLPRMARGQIVGEGDRWLLVFLARFVVFGVAGQHLAGEEDQEHGHEDQR